MNGFAGRLRRAWKRRVWLNVLRRFHPQVDVRGPNGVVRVDLRDDVIGAIVYLDGEYEAELQRLFAAAHLEGGVCVDIGANIGLHTIAMGRLAGAGGHVYAFEPEARNFELLERNLRRNGVRNVSALRNAVGDREGVVQLAVHPTNYGDHRIASRGRNWNTGAAAGSPAVNVQEVPLTTIDAALAQVPAGAIRLIKIDVQGFESNVLRGMRETFRRNPDTLLMIEVFPEGLAAAGSSASELAAQLRDLGFTGWEYHDHRLIPMLEPWAYDLIRGGKYQDLVLSRGGERITEVLERLYGAPLHLETALRA